MNSYPHMCRDGHQEIGHRDGEHEHCPLCRANARSAKLEAALERALLVIRQSAHMAHYGVAENEEKAKSAVAAEMAKHKE